MDDRPTSRRAGYPAAGVTDMRKGFDGLAALVQRKEEPPPGDVVRYATALAEAAGLVRDWPNSFVPALECAVVGRSLSRRNVRYTGVADHVPALNSPTLPPLVRSEIANVLAPITAVGSELPAD